MELSDISGPGVEDWLIGQLTTWGIETLTDVQVRALAAGVAGGQSMIVSAPTSTGKTLVGEIAVLAALRKSVRAIYLVSHKALADQKYLDFVQRFGEEAIDPIASVGLNTGDRTEGDVDAQLVVATYEKALGLILSNQLKTTESLVVADELQILGERGRGPDIETLCAAIRQRGIAQFVALTATVENPEDLAGWMGCKLVQSFHRDVPLHQEIWANSRVYRTTFGQTDGEAVDLGVSPSNDVAGVVTQLIDLGREPVLVFTESRREASNYAAAFGESRPRVGIGMEIAEQLDLFSEPTESSERLKDSVERQVTFHSADLAPQERQVIERGFSESNFDVCFATSTLAAGVNFPFRSIVFPKLTYDWGDRAGTRVTRSDYRNMSGRAGRLGMHPDGFAVLIPKNAVELRHANNLVLPDNDRLESQLVNLSLRKTILTLVSSGLASNLDEIMEFFQNTLFWYQILDRNPDVLADVEGRSKAAVKWLAQELLIDQSNGHLSATPLGNATALSGLLPTTAVKFANLLRELGPELRDALDAWVPGLIYAVCSSDEFCSDRPARYLPYASRRSHDSITFWSTKKLPIDLDRSDLRVAQSSHAIVQYLEGVAERKIAFATHVSSGGVHRLAIDVAWVLDGLHKLTCVPEVGFPQTVSNQLAMLARRVRWGVPAEALDVLRIAQRHGVPGFGRQRAMTLIAQGISSLSDVLGATRDILAKLLRNDQRAEALLEAAASAVGPNPNRLTLTHERVASDLGIEKIVLACNKELGVEYEGAIYKLLNVETSWNVTGIDNGKRQNVPDLLIEFRGKELLLECKTCTKSPQLIKKEEAFAVLQKAADFGKEMRRVTLGKPAFDETSGETFSHPVERPRRLKCLFLNFSHEHRFRSAPSADICSLCCAQAVRAGSRTHHPKEDDSRAVFTDRYSFYFNVRKPWINAVPRHVVKALGKLDAITNGV